VAAFQAIGTSTERTDRLKRSEIGLAMIGEATLKKGLNHLTQVFFGVKFKELL
jgi:hypothetical protein